MHTSTQRSDTISLSSNFPLADRRKMDTKRFERLPLLLASLVLIGVVVLAAFAPWISPYDPNEMNLRHRLRPPLTEGHLLGTDHLGRDLLSRLMYGARVSAVVGVSSVLLAGAIGTSLGAIAGYYGGLVDRILGRIVDVQLAFPFLVLAITIAAVLGPSLSNVVVTLAVSSWPVYARVVRAETLALRQKLFVEAAIASGAPGPSIIARHILPNLLPSLLVLASLELGRVIVAEASVSFLGYGVPPPSPAWGRMLEEGRPYMTTAWWLTVFPGLCIMLTTLAANLFGDWVRDRLDPYERSNSSV